MYLVLGEVLFRNLALPLKPINQLSSRRTGNWYTRRPFWASFQGLPQGMGLLLLAKLIVVMLLYNNITTISSPYGYGALQLRNYYAHQRSSYGLRVFCAVNTGPVFTLYLHVFTAPNSQIHVIRILGPPPKPPDPPLGTHRRSGASLYR